MIFVIGRHIIPFVKVFIIYSLPSIEHTYIRRVKLLTLFNIAVFSLFRMHRSSHVGLAAFLVLQYIVCPTLVTEARGERSRPIDGKKSNVCYQLRPVRGNAQGGHIFRCFRNRPMSFEGCRLLLGVCFVMKTFRL